MGKYQAYPKYQESGEEWLGKVPNHWKVIQIKHLSSVKRGASPRPIDDPKYFDEGGEYVWTRIADVTASDVYLTKAPQRLSDLGSSLSVKLEPESLFLSIAGTVGKPCITGMKACIHDGFVYFPELKIPSKFLFYVFAGEQAYKGLGKFGTQLNLNTDTVGGIKIGCTENEELEKIVNFLDHETAKIDTLIEKQQQLIALLKEKRQAVISHAVTKGLNANAPMRDSGVEWLGEVPEHWIVCKIKQVAKLESGHTPDKKIESYWVDCDIPWVSLNDSTQLKQVDYITKTAFYLNEKGIENSSARKLPARCVVFTRDASIGLAAVTTKVMAVSQHVIAWVCDEEKVIPEYLLLIFYAMKDELDRYTAGATLKTIGLPDVNKLSAAFPNTETQNKIIKHVFSEMKKFDLLIEKSELAVGIIKERRRALISAVVTGKIDVRSWSAV